MAFHPLTDFRVNNKIFYGLVQYTKILNTDLSITAVRHTHRIGIANSIHLG